MRRLRETDLDELLEQAEPTAEPSPTKAQTPVARTLELQQTAGNRAVGAALQRWPMPFARPTAQWPKEPQVIVDGTAVPMVSYSWADGPNLGTGGGGPGKAHFREVNISIRPGKLSAELGVKAARGEQIKTVIIVMPKGDGGHTITFKDVLISNFQAAGDTDTFTANFAAYEMGTSPPRS